MSGSGERGPVSGADGSSSSKRSAGGHPDEGDDPIRLRLAAMAERFHPGFTDELCAKDEALRARREQLAEKREAAKQNSVVRRANKKPQRSNRRHYGVGPNAKLREAQAGARQSRAAERKRRRDAYNRPPKRRREARFLEAKGRQKEYLDGLRRELAEVHGTTIGATPEIPAVDWRIRSECLAIARDRTGKTGARYAQQLPARIRHQLCQFLPKFGGWATRAGRRLVECVWITWRLGRPVKGGARVVDGFCRRVWCLLAVDADGHVPSISTLWGTHNGRQQTPGPMTVLRRLGMWTRVQPPSGDARYVGFSGWAVGQCWFSAAMLEAPRDEAEEKSFAEELQALLAALDPG